MKEIFEEYGGPIITVMVIVALIAIIAILVASDGPIATNIKDMVTGLFSKVGIASSQTVAGSVASSVADVVSSVAS